MVNTEAKQETKELYENAVQSTTTVQIYELSEKKWIHEGVKPDQPYECKKCKKLFSQKKYLTKHLKTIHEGIKAFNCQACQKSFTAKHNLDYHIAVTHEKNLNEEELFPCLICHRDFSYKHHLKKHVKQFMKVLNLISVPCANTNVQ